MHTNLVSPQRLLGLCVRLSRAELQCWRPSCGQRLARPVLRGEPSYAGQHQRCAFTWRSSILVRTIRGLCAQCSSEGRAHTPLAV